MKQEMMTIDRVLDLIAAYGAHPGGWPEDERDAAEAVLNANPAAFADALHDAEVIDAMLMDAPQAEPSSDLVARIMADAPCAATPKKAGLLTRLKDMIFPQGTRWPASAALASLTMGVVAGYSYAAIDVTYDEADTAYASAFGFDDSADWLSEGDTL
jgi:hypothetical protein